MSPMIRTLPPEAEIIHAAVLRTINEQMGAVGGPPTKAGMAWAIIHGLYAAGWRIVPEQDEVES